MTTQLRILRIKPGPLDAYLDAWLDGAYPLRIAHGFRVDGTWIARAEHRVVTMLTYDGPGTFEAKDAAYYASAAFRALEPDPSQYIERMEAFFITPALPMVRWWLSSGEGS